MVMPHSALRTGQHLKWRRGNYKRKGGRNAPSIGLNFQIHEPWDLDNVVPDFFPMPASVIFAEYTGMSQGAPLAPGTVQVWHGDWQEDYADISRKSEALHHDDGRFKSPYAELSSQGPTITDRRLFFVETVPHTAMLPAANTTNVQPRRPRVKLNRDARWDLLGRLGRSQNELAQPVRAVLGIPFPIDERQAQPLAVCSTMVAADSGRGGPGPETCTGRQLGSKGSTYMVNQGTPPQTTVRGRRDRYQALPKQTGVKEPSRTIPRGGRTDGPARESGPVRQGADG